METLIVEIVIAASGESVDFILPAHVKLSALMPGILDLIEQTHQELCFDRETPMLCDMQMQKIIPSSLTLAQGGVRYGHRLLLV